MADTRPTPLGFMKAVRLCLFAIFAPGKLIEAEKADNAARQQYSTAAPHEPSALIVRRAFWTSLTLVILFGAGGYSAGKSVTPLLGCVGSSFVVGTQLVGALLLLWGTLFVRGWDIRTWSGMTLTERVNEWIYRTMYCIGTAALAFSLGLVPCSR